MVPSTVLLFIASLQSLSTLPTIEAFAPTSSISSVPRSNLSTNSSRCGQLRQRNFVLCTSNNQSDDELPPINQPTRRQLLQSTAALTLTPLSASASLNPFTPTAPEPFRPSPRCTAYLVDSTIPPSLIPYRASREASILKNLGMGSGTSKEPFAKDEINLNNFMNKAVFGVIDSAKELTGGANRSKDGVSFIFLGANFDGESPTARGDVGADAELAVSLMKDICKQREREGNTAIGLGFAPVSAQKALDEYVADGGLDRLMGALKLAGAHETLAQRHAPIFQFAREKKYPLLALLPDPSDLANLAKGGLQSLDPQKRDMYVADAEGFINLTRNPKFQLYTDKSLLKDFSPSSPTISEEQFKEEQANFFAERILVHEAAATRIAKWAASRPNSLVITVAPVADVRFMGGMNGRLGRVYGFLKEGSLSEDAVTTILLNPSARETLSESKFLRLEIGTAPNNWAYQTKVADYFWFSSMPKVNMLPRMMNEQ